TIGKFFFQFGVTVGVAVFLSLVCALTLTPMLCAFFLNVRQRIPQRPLPFRVPFALLAGSFAVLAGVTLRVLAVWLPGVTSFAWPVLDVTDGVLGLFGGAAFWPRPAGAPHAALGGGWGGA